MSRSPEPRCGHALRGRLTSHSAATFQRAQVSPPFLFPRLFRTDADWVQFCSGLTVSGGRAQISYGVGDCASMAVSMPEDDFLAFAGVDPPPSFTQ